MPDPPPFVVDASGLINLVAIDRVIDLIGAIPEDFLVTDHVVAEVGEEDLRNLLSTKLLTSVPLDSIGIDTFLSLAGANPPDDLDDGEASTIAFASRNGCVAVVDERKGTRMGLNLLGPGRVVSTIDIFRRDEVVAALGIDGLREALLQSLQRARMRVPPAHRDWVLALIGPEREALCPSLKRRR